MQYLYIKYIYNSLSCRDFIILFVIISPKYNIIISYIMKLYVEIVPQKKIFARNIDCNKNLLENVPQILAKFPQNRCQNSPKSGVKIPPNFVSKLHRKSHFLVGPRGPPILARNPPKIKNSLLAQQRELFLAIFGPRARRAPKIRARAAGPPGARRAGRPAPRVPPSRFAGPSLIYTCPQDRRRPQAEANKRRPGSANDTRGVARNSVEDTEQI